MDEISFGDTPLPEDPTDQITERVDVENVDERRSDDLDQNVLGSLRERQAWTRSHQILQRDENKYSAKAQCSIPKLT
jgi:hypothetical protein